MNIWNAYLLSEIVLKFASENLEKVLATSNSFRFIKIPFLEKKQKSIKETQKQEGKKANYVSYDMQHSLHRTIILKSKSFLDAILRRLKYCNIKIIL